MTQLRLVKNAALISEGDLIKVQHYDTIIATYNKQTEIANVLSGLSPTSNRQIKYFLEFTNPKKIINDNEDFKVYEKNAFSEPLRA